MKIWAKTKQFSEGKFLVVRRDGSAPHWPHFVLGARDPHASVALRAYATSLESQPTYDPEYAGSIRELAADFDRYREQEGLGDPEAPPHRKDNSAVLAAMRGEMAYVFVRPDKANVKKKAVVCRTCSDSHVMMLNDRRVPCTHCPTPCEECRAQKIGAYCEATPCPCRCHRA